MKTIYKKIILLILLNGLFISCNENNIDLEPIGLTEATFYQDVEQMRTALFGVYNYSAAFYKYHSGAQNTNPPLWLLPGDDLTTNRDVEDETFAGIDGNYNRSNRFYTYAYRLISQANALLEKIEENGDQIYEDAVELRDYHKGEALFFRGWTNFRLWNVFETAPVVKNRIVTLEDSYLPNAEGTELLDQAITDLNDAADLLPEEWDSDNLGRITKNAAYGMLGKVLVFRGTVTDNVEDFTRAITAFDNIEGRSLTAQYNDNFDVEKENNQESLFEVQVGSEFPGNPWLPIEVFPNADLTHYLGYFSGRPGNSPQFVVTSLLENAYDPADPRIRSIFDTEGTGNKEVVKYLKNTSFTRANMSVSNNNPRVLRYADVLLLKAEAIVRTGGDLNEAIYLINQVRERARLSTDDGTESLEPADRDVNETDPDTVLDWVFTERRLELAAEEGHRWWDLRRRHKAGEIDLMSWDFGSINTGFDFQEYNIRYPLPLEEIQLNPNLTQNTGY